LLSKVVERARKCVDFTFTLYFIHILCCTMYEGIPLAWEWWVVNVFGSVAMASLGEYLCATREMEDIPLYSNGK
jgi:protein SYS1